MGLAGRGRCVLCSFLFLAEIGSGSPTHTILDLGHDHSCAPVTDSKCELELDFLPQRGSLVELRLLCALLVAVPHARRSFASYSQPALRLVYPLPRLSSVCKLVGLSCLAPQWRRVTKQLIPKVASTGAGSAGTLCDFGPSCRPTLPLLVFGLCPVCRSSGQNPSGVVPLPLSRCR